MEQTIPITSHLIRSQLALQDLSYLPFLFSVLAFLFVFLGLSIDVAVNVVVVVDPNDAARGKSHQNKSKIANDRFDEKSPKRNETKQNDIERDD